MSSEVTIRDAHVNDAQTISEFNIAMALETEQKKLERTKIEPGVIAVFQRPELGFYLVGEISGRIAGCLMVTPEWSDWRNAFFWWVQSVYVAPEFRNRGVYKALYNTVRERAENRPEICGCRLYVEQENESAQHAYEKLGMKKTCYQMYEELFRK
jgi:ribosomal protein S18 acetylase RimI-like enzyme